MVLESTGAKYLGLFGSRYPTTPNLEREAAHARVFDRFYAHVGLTANSVAAMSLSVYPYMTWREYTVEYPRFPGETLAQLLGPRGYRTAFLHSGHLEYVNQESFLQDRGFHELLDWKDLEGGPGHFSWGGSDRVLIDRTLDWIDRDRSRPFYAVVWTQQSHHPYDPVPGQETRDFFEGSRLPPDDWDLGRYLNTVRDADAQLGRLFAGLRERGLADDTLVVVTGDHGETFGDPHPTWGHGFRVYEESVRVPMMVWNPRLFPKGGRSDVVGGHVDINPTVAHLLGVPASPTWQGRSLFDPAAAAAGLFLRGQRRLPARRPRGRLEVRAQRDPRPRRALPPAQRPRREDERGRAPPRALPRAAPARRRLAPSRRRAPGASGSRDGGSHGLRRMTVYSVRT